MKLDAARIAEQFRFSGELLRVLPHGTGHIHDTYAVWFRRRDGSSRRYLLQRINHYVFRDPEGLMGNIAAVTDHLRTGIAAKGGDPERETLTLVPTRDGNTQLKTANGEYWRAYLFIEGATAYAVARDDAHVHSVGRAFGDFHTLLADFPAEQLRETIPDFHNTPKRLQSLEQAVSGNASNRASGARPEIDFVFQRAHRLSTLLDLRDSGALPLRVTHNDTKIDNVLIDDETGEGICVIDLDTVMPGLLAYDFGDAVRAATNSAAEDERDLAKVSVDLGAYEQLVRGFLDASRGIWTAEEGNQLCFSSWLLTLELGMRFLTDHLNGDVYFKVHRQDHNLDRCRSQLAMVKDMEDKFELMQTIVEAHC
ncbi:MAG TPA: aminoglycoside phosphotransferase family protein [Anaerolineae bacterium]|nr:aminoglycoside phosphotransferase family protein [Anaerolineae bacterium]